MKKYTRESGIAKAGLLRYCAKICKGLGRVAEKLVTEMMYGIAAGNSCHLTEIARALEEDIGVKKTADRLSRGLQRFEAGAVLQGNYLKGVQKHVDDITPAT